MEPAEGGRVKRDSEDADDRRFEPKRQYHDIGPAIAEAEFRPRIFGNPEQTLGATFIAMGKDYGGPLVGGPAGVARPMRRARSSTSYDD
jgi:hypothetical protein